MELIINDVAKIEADFTIESDYFVISKEVLTEDEKDSLFDLFSKEGLIKINDGNTTWNLKKIQTSYSSTSDSDHYDVKISFKKYTKEDKLKEDTPDFKTLLLIENFYNRLRIEGIQNILIDKGIIGSKEDFSFDKMFGEEKHREFMEKYRKEFMEAMNIDLEE